MMLWNIGSALVCIGLGVWAGSTPSDKYYVAFSEIAVLGALFLLFLNNLAALTVPS